MTSTNTTSKTAPSVRPRRSPATAALGATLVAVLGASGWYLGSNGGQTQPVVALKAPVAAGQRFTAAELGTTHISPDTGLATIPADRLDQLVGKYATTNLPSGSLVSDEEVTDQLLPGPGRSVVGVSVKPSQMPTTGLSGGQKVRIVAIGGNGPSPATGAGPALGTSWDGVVVAVGEPGDDRSVTVDVDVPQPIAAAIATAAGSNGGVALILNPR